MADIVDPATRSRMMSHIRGKDTKPEILLRKALFRRGFRYRLNAKELSGKPDIVFPKWNAVVFVHGCFWHRHTGCRYTTTPATRPEFWDEKFRRNVERDQENLENLHQAGWRTAIVWECSLRQNPDKVSLEVAQWLSDNRSTELELP